MDEQIKKLVRILQIQYWLFISLAIAYCAVYEIGWIEEGIYAGDVRLQYIWETIAILTTVILVPLSLKLFNIIMTKKVVKSSLQVAMRLYKRWNEIRLLMLAIVTFLNIYVYYTTLDNIGGLCALIGVTASIFCLPSEKKLKEELNITNTIEE
ncbi:MULTISPECIES: hypothetical protein [unclassified Bacteroides]|mgnify:CR=1 FL=1|jgi:hypothetical protein|uniref:hypothetical protein n=1 Tax=unclassified Bacteroides TaxID=2646097 RepID=UPI000E9EFFD1|nr:MULTISPECIES: hypothetical protein [unclassified Bacteroides]RGN50715.1 hypothetical protein DXB63_02145 [Bacteroides sp. OM05-12]RHR76539.1 hypothetical protein DWW69_07900 [Bacteroides sp. AF16-49]